MWGLWFQIIIFQAIHISAKEMTSFFLVTICPDHANEKEKNMWPTTVVSPVTPAVLHVASSCSPGTSAGQMASYLTQLVLLGHTINLSSVASSRFWVSIEFLVRNSIFGLCKQLFLVPQVRVAYLSNSISVSFDSLCVKMWPRKRQFFGNLEFRFLYFGANIYSILTALSKIHQDFKSLLKPLQNVK